MFALEIFKDNHRAKFQSNILLTRSTQQIKLMVVSRNSHHPNVFRRIMFGNMRKINRKTSLAKFFLGCRPATLVEKILMNKCFSANGCKHLWMAASDLGKYPKTDHHVWFCRKYLKFASMKQYGDRGYSMFLWRPMLLGKVGSLKCFS